jgi:hypothetical protein
MHRGGRRVRSRAFCRVTSLAVALSLSASGVVGLTSQVASAAPNPCSAESAICTDVEHLAATAEAIVGDAKIDCQGEPTGVQGCVAYVQAQIQAVQNDVQRELGCSPSECVARAEAAGLSAIASLLQLANAAAAEVASLAAQCLDGSTSVCNTAEGTANGLIAQMLALVRSCADQTNQTCATAVDDAKAAANAVLGFTDRCVAGNDTTCNGIENEVISLGFAVEDFVLACAASADSTCQQALATADSVAASAVELGDACIDGGDATCEIVTQFLPTPGYISTLNFAMDDGASAPAPLRTAQQVDVLLGSSSPDYAIVTGAANAGLPASPPPPDNSHPRPVIRCSHGGYAFSDSNGTETIRYNCPYSNVNWGWRMSAGTAQG